MDGISVYDLAKTLGFKCETPGIDSRKVTVTETDINRPALQLAGFYDYFQPRRVQVIGNVECAYLDSLDDETRFLRVENLFSKKIPCLVMCRGHKPSERMLSLAEKHNVSIFTTEEGTSEASEKIIHYIQKETSPVITIHGVLIDVFGEGVLITGESGIGKSEAALELVKRGHRLVADDAVELHLLNNDTLIGNAPEVTRDFIELRGVGIIDVKSLFGLESVKPEQAVSFVINIEDWDKNKEYDRLGNSNEKANYLGVELTKYSVPLRPGRNLAVIVEAIAVNYRQITLGYNAVDELYRRVQNNMDKED